MTRYRIVSWADLFAPHPAQMALQTQGAIIDSAMTPLIGDRLCVQGLFYNPDKFYALPGEGSPLFAGGSVADDQLTLPAPPRPTRKIPGRSVLIGSMVNFGHFVINHLPRLALALDLDLAADNYIVADAPPFVAGFFEAAGVDPSKIVSICGDDIAEIDDLTVLPMLCCSQLGGGRLLIAPNFPQQMRRRLARLSDAPKARLYLPRDGVRWRRLLNEEAVIAALQPLGFTIYRPEQDPIRRQLEVIGDASLIVSVRGAGGQLAAFAPSGAQVLWLEPPNMKGGQWAEACFLGAGVGQRVLVGTAAESTTGRDIDADFAIDPNIVVRSLRLMSTSQKVSSSPKMGPT